MDNLKFPSSKIPFSLFHPKFVRGLHRYISPSLTNNFHFEFFIPGFDDQRTRVLIRVDDYPRWDIDTNKFKIFHEILFSNGIPYVLGVTPFLNFDGTNSRGGINPDDIKYIKLIEKQGVEIALHGFTHKYYIGNKGWPCETSEYNNEELNKQLALSAEWFNKNELKFPVHYIPPFNTFDSRDYNIITKNIPIIHGGPLSLSTFGMYAPGFSRDQKSYYLPCYEPFYGRAVEILPFLKRLFNKNVPFRHVVITLHWAWELATEYEHVESLIDFLVVNNLYPTTSELRLLRNKMQKNQKFNG